MPITFPVPALLLAAATSAFGSSISYGPCMVQTFTVEPTFQLTTVYTGGESDPTCRNYDPDLGLQSVPMPNTAAPILRPADPFFGLALTGQTSMTFLPETKHKVGFIETNHVHLESDPYPLYATVPGTGPAQLSSSVFWGCCIIGPPIGLWGHEGPYGEGWSIRIDPVPFELGVPSYVGTLTYVGDFDVRSHLGVQFGILWGNFSIQVVPIAPSGTSIPEPGTTALTTLAGVFLLSLRFVCRTGAFRA